MYHSTLDALQILKNHFFLCIKFKESFDFPFHAVPPFYAMCVVIYCKNVTGSVPYGINPAKPEVLKLLQNCQRSLVRVYSVHWSSYLADHVQVEATVDGMYLKVSLQRTTCTHVQRGAQLVKRAELESCRPHKFLAENSLPARVLHLFQRGFCTGSLT
eukprot:jgi/Botrbrau1/21497/Bobra.174_2s0006.1